MCPASARGSPAAHLLLPAALVAGSFVHASLPALPFLVAFLAHMRAPPRRGFPYSASALLGLYALGLVALHVSLAALVAQGRIDPARAHSATLDAFAVPRYDVSAWEGLRTLLGPLLVLAACFTGYLMRHPPTGMPYYVRAVTLVRAYLVARKREAGGDADLPRNLERTPRPHDLRAPVVRFGAPPSRGRRKRVHFPALPSGWVTLERIEEAIGGGDSDTDEETMVRRLTQHAVSEASLSIASPVSAPLLHPRDSQPAGQTYSPRVSISGAVGTPGDHVDLDAAREVDTPVLSDRARLVAGTPESARPSPPGLTPQPLSELDVEAQNDGVRNVVVPEFPSRLTKFMAGYGGVFWCTLSMALLGMSYSSMLTFFFLLPTLVVMAIWTLPARENDGSQDLAGVARSQSFRRAADAMRVYLAAYIIAIYAFQLPWLGALRSSATARLVGLVVLDTHQPYGWAHVLAMGAAIFAYVVTSMHAKAVNAVVTFDEYIASARGREWSSDRGVDSGLGGPQMTPTDTSEGGAGVRSQVRATGETSGGSELPGPSGSRTGEHDTSEVLRSSSGMGGRDIVTLRDTGEQLPSHLVDDNVPKEESLHADIRAGRLPAVLEATSMLDSGLQGCEQGVVTVHRLGKPPLSFNTEVGLTVLVHMSSLGLLVWALVFPGILTLPLLFGAYMSLLSSRRGHDRKVKCLLWYALVLEMCQFTLSAITVSFDLEAGPVLWILGLRTFNPQFVMNVVQTLGILFLSLSIFARRRLRENPPPRYPDASLDVEESMFYLTQVTMKTTTFVPLKVFVDQVALASLYVTGGYEPSVLNVLFLLALVAICLFQATPVGHPKALSVMWIAIMLYSSAFLLVNSSVCRAGSQIFTCDYKTLGLQAADTQRSVAYATTLVMSAVQVHFTWQYSSDNRDSQRLPEFQTPFWSFLLEYFVYFAYGALLLYPLVYPANYLSYVYMVFLWICILVEILVPNVALNNTQVQGARGLIRGFWFLLVLFSALALLARYFVRFEEFARRESINLWVFGLERGVIEFQITLGDAVVLIMMSLQGRIFNISLLLEADKSVTAAEMPLSGHSTAEMSTSRSRSSHSSRSQARSDVQELVPENHDGSESAGARIVRPVAAEKGSPVTASASGPLISTPWSPLSRKEIRFAEESWNERETSLLRSRRLARAGLAERSASEGIDEVSSERSHSGVPQNVALKRLKNLRKSLPVKQTERFLSSAFKYLTIVLRLLMPYNYVLEAVAILIAAVWLDGVTVFGAVYLVLGCVLLVSEQYVHDDRRCLSVKSQSDSRGTSDEGSCGRNGRRSDDDLEHDARWTSPWSARVLPPVLVILSFCLMTVQYLYIILSSSGKLWGEIALYLGLQATPLLPNGEPDISMLPISQNAMLAHVLVFVMAFLQRAAIRWISLDEQRARDEEQTHRQHMAAPMPAPEMYSTAVPISNVYAGVGGSGSAVENSTSPNASSGGLGELLDNSMVNPTKYVESDGVHSGNRSSSEDDARVHAPQEPSAQGPLLESTRSASDADEVKPADREPVSSESGIGKRMQYFSSFPRDSNFRGFALHGVEGSFNSLNSSNSALGRPGSRTMLRGAVTSGTSGSHFSEVEVQGVEYDATGTTVEKVRSALVWSVKELFKRAREVSSLLTPFWQNWGFDLTFIYLVFGGVITNTIFSVIYVAFVLVVGRRKKSHVRQHWRLLTLILVTLVVSQYLLTLGRPPTGTKDGDDGFLPLGREWQQWLYLDSINTRSDVFREAPASRKAGIMFGFMAVICAGITLNSLDLDEKVATNGRKRLGAGDVVGPLGGEEREARAPTERNAQDNAESSDGVRVTLALIDRIAHPEHGARGRLVRYQSEGIAVHAPERAFTRRANDARLSTGLVLSDALTESAARSQEGPTESPLRDVDGSVEERPPSDPMMRQNGGDKLTRIGTDRSGGIDSDDTEDDDFTRRPRSFENGVKLAWMRLAGSAVQLCMFAIATVDTNCLSAVLLFLAFYFFFQFTNMETKQARFVVVRTYVLVVILVLVVYQAPFPEPESSWARIVGLYKASSNNLLYLMLALWLLCQMQSRIYESRNFKYVVKCTQEDEKVRHRRAVHEHNDRLYERMLGQNKNERAQAARTARHKALQTLKERNEQPPTALFYRVCVTNWVAYLKRRAETQECKDEKARERQERERHEDLRQTKSSYERTFRYLLRGSEWVKHANRPVVLEVRLFITRYSSWPVYITMILAPIFAPSVLTLVYPIVLFLYFVVEKPRPPRTAWTALILYVYAVILLKYVGRKPEFDFVSCPDDDYQVPFFATRKISATSEFQPSLSNLNWCVLSTGLFFDVLVLLALMWHRAQLYYRGLWDLPRSEEDLRVSEHIQGHVVEETPCGMEFGRFDEADVPPSGYSFTRGMDDVIRRPETRYVFVPMAEQCRAANDVLRQASKEISALAKSTGSEEWDPSILVGPDEEHVKQAGAALESSREVSFIPIKISKPRDLEAEYTGVRRVDEAHGRSGFEPEEGKGEGGPSNWTKLFGDSDDEKEEASSGAWRDRARVERNQVGFHSGVREMETRELRFRRASESHDILGTSTNALDFPEDRGLSHPRRTATAGSSARSLEGARFGGFRRRRSGARRDLNAGRDTDILDEDDEGREAGPALQSLLASRILAPRGEGEGRHTFASSVQPRPDSGPRGSEAAEANLSALRSGSNRAGPSDLLRAHYQRLLRENLHKTVGDYYIAIFSMDFICFVYMMFGYSYIFESQTEQSAIRTWWQSNFIASDHLAALIVLFFGIVVDRIVYLRKSMLGKLVIQYLSVIGYHYWLFWRTNIGTRTIGKVFYVLKCGYFLLSGLQIRTGYPRYTTGQYLLRKYNTGGLVLFTIYENIPFLWLTRTLLDWAVVPTSLELFQYFRFVDIYMWLYRNRAVNTSRGMFRRRLGQRRWWFPRVYQGLGLSLVCGLLLFFPFLLFSFLNPFFNKRELVESRIGVAFVSEENTFNLFQRSTATRAWRLNNDEDKVELEVFERRYGISPVLRENENLFHAQFASLSESLWLPTPSDVSSLVSILESNSSEPLLSFTLISVTDTQVFRTVAKDELNVLKIDFDARVRMSKSISAGESFAEVMSTPLSKHLILASGSRKFQVADISKENKRTCVRLVRVNKSVGTDSLGFWSFEDCPLGECACDVIDGTTMGSDQLAAKFSIDKHAIQVLLQVANVSSFQFGGGTILTVYAAILFTVAGLARRIMSDKRLIVPYIDMPYTLHLYQLVLDIVYARQDEDFVMEEILYNGLIDIYRDSSELARWSGQRALKPHGEWWNDPNYPLIDGYDGWPSFRATETEPYIERKVD